MVPGAGILAPHSMRGSPGQVQARVSMSGCLRSRTLREKGVFRSLASPYRGEFLTEGLLVRGAAIHRGLAKTAGFR
jgi:hypothetical protein